MAAACGVSPDQMPFATPSHATYSRFVASVGDAVRIAAWRMVVRLLLDSGVDATLNLYADEGTKAGRNLLSCHVSLHNTRKDDSEFCFVGSPDLCGDQSADANTQSITHLLDVIGIPKPSVRTFLTDGCNTNTGRQNGIVVQLKKAVCTNVEHCTCGLHVLHLGERQANTTRSGSKWSLSRAEVCVANFLHSSNLFFGKNDTFRVCISLLLARLGLSLPFCPAPVDTRWLFAYKAGKWIMDNAKTLKKVIREVRKARDPNDKLMVRIRRNKQFTIFAGLFCTPRIIAEVEIFVLFVESIVLPMHSFMIGSDPKIRYRTSGKVLQPGVRGHQMYVHMEKWKKDQIASAATARARAQSIARKHCLSSGECDKLAVNSAAAECQFTAKWCKLLAFWHTRLPFIVMAIAGDDDCAREIASALIVCFSEGMSSVFSVHALQKHKSAIARISERVNSDRAKTCLNIMRAAKIEAVSQHCLPPSSNLLELLKGSEEMQEELITFAVGAANSSDTHPSISRFALLYGWCCRHVYSLLIHQQPVEGFLSKVEYHIRGRLALRLTQARMFLVSYPFGSLEIRPEDVKEQRREARNETGTVMEERYGTLVHSQQHMTITSSTALGVFQKKKSSILSAQSLVLDKDEAEDIDDEAEDDDKEELIHFYGNDTDDDDDDDDNDDDSDKEKKSVLHAPVAVPTRVMPVRGERRVICCEVTGCRHQVHVHGNDMKRADEEMGVHFGLFHGTDDEDDNDDA